jgi:RHS repeat-associated protein
LPFHSTLSHQIKERYIYGSNRVGTFIEEAEMIGSSTTNTSFSHHLGARNYELVNHLGNALAVVSDAPIEVDTNNDHLRDYNLPTLLSSQDYYPFGSLMRERSFGGYRYGFNGMEKDEEVKGNGNSLDFGARIYDSRLGRWLSIDPLHAEFPGASPFSFVENSPLWAMDPDGMKLVKVHLPKSKYMQGLQTLIVDEQIARKVLELARYAVKNEINVHFNSAFRSSEKQKEIQSTGTTPAEVGTSRHEAGFALDFNLYDDDGEVIKGNSTVKATDAFIVKAKELGFRWGGEFNTPDRIHIDAWDPSVVSKFGYDNWKEAYTENQSQVDIEDFTGGKVAPLSFEQSFLTNSFFMSNEQLFEMYNVDAERFENPESKVNQLEMKESPAVTL